MKGEAAKPFDYDKVGRRWGFWERFLIGFRDDLYLDRLGIVTTPWFSIKLHRIYRPDRQRDLHDHPWNFVSFILRGSYVEDTPQGQRRRRWFNFKRAEDRHSIREVSRSPVWTLIYTGPKRRSWGFWRGGKFIPWRQYDKLMDA